MPSDTDKPLNGKPEPFRRPVMWSRPPATVFRAGPLPKGERSPPPPAAPRLGPVPGILGGSMIPGAAASPAPAAGPAAEPAAAPAPATPAFEPDLTVRPLPTPGDADPVEPIAAQPAAPEPVAPEPVVSGPVVSRPVASDPLAGPAVSAHPGHRPTSRTLLYSVVVLAAVTVAVLAGWIWTRSAPGNPAPAVAVAPTIIAPDPVVPGFEPAPVFVAEPAAEPAIETPAPVPAPQPAPAATHPAAPTPPVVIPPPTVSAPARIETTPVPVPGPAPTAAERPPADPDAPVPTRPQPID